MEIYKANAKTQFQNYEIFNQTFKELGNDEIDDLSADEFDYFSGILLAIDRNFLSNRDDWIEKSILKLMDLTREKNVALNALIVNSDAYSTLCANFSSDYTLYILRISLNLTAKSPYIVYILINSNIIYTVLENLRSTDDSIVSTCLKIINNLINSSYYSRICLVSSGFFEYALNFFSSPNKLDDLHYMGKLIEYLIACFFDPSISSLSNSAESQALGLNDPQKLPNLLTQTQDQLSSDSKNLALDLDVAQQILLTKNGLELDASEPLWKILDSLINKPDSYLIKCGLISLRRFSRNSNDTVFIFKNTSLFDNCKDICSRNNPVTIENLFNLFSQFFFVVGEKANRQFIRNGLFDVVIRYFNHSMQSLRIAAMKCISNCLCFESNLNLIDHFFTDDLVTDMIDSARDDNIVLHEKEVILFILINLAEINPQVRFLLFSSVENMELMIDFLGVSSKDFAVLILDVLAKLIDTQDNYDVDFDVLDLFIQCDGVETIENLIDNQLEYVAQSAQAFFDNYLKEL